MSTPVGVHKMCIRDSALADTGFTGEVYVWSCQSLGKKDPSDVYLAHGKDCLLYTSQAGTSTSRHTSTSTLTPPSGGQRPPLEAGGGHPFRPLTCLLYTSRCV